MEDEIVDVLSPPLFEKTGITKSREQAFADGDWIPTFILTVIRTSPVPAILFQFRHRNKSWEPGKLDISASGHYKAGESMLDGLREAEEELGITYKTEDVRFLGRWLYVGFDTDKRERKNVVHVFAVIDNTSLSRYTLQEDEVEGLYALPIDEIITIMKRPDHQFSAVGIDAGHKPSMITVTSDMFIRDWNNLKLKLAFAAKRILRGEEDIFI